VAYTLTSSPRKKKHCHIMGDDFELSFEDQFEDHAVDSDTPSRSNSLKLKKGNTDSQRRKEKRRSKVGIQSSDGPITSLAFLHVAPLFMITSFYFISFISFGMRRRLNQQVTAKPVQVLKRRFRQPLSLKTFPFP
jgi:hypothetical protein